MQRIFWLTDRENTERFDFTAFGDFIFSNPTSLGIYREKEFLIVNNQRIEVSDVPTFKAITGTVIIRGAYKDLEAKYATLRDFISKHNAAGFRLYCKTQEDVAERYIKCAIDTLDKSEKSTANTMLVQLNILPESLWLGDVSGASVAQKVSVSGVFRFAERAKGFGARFEQRPLTNEFGKVVYGIAFGGEQLSQAFIFNSGEVASPLTIRIYGGATSPYLSLKDYTTGEVLQDVKFNNLIVPSGSYVEINANPDGAYIELVNEETGARLDVEDYADESTSIYMSLPVGAYVIEAGDELATNAVRTRVFFTNQYKGA